MSHKHPFRKSCHASTNSNFSCKNHIIPRLKLCKTHLKRSKVLWKPHARSHLFKNPLINNKSTRLLESHCRMVEIKIMACKGRKTPRQDHLLLKIFSHFEFYSRFTRIQVKTLGLYGMHNMKLTSNDDLPLSIYAPCLDELKNVRRWRNGGENEMGGEGFTALPRGREERRGWGVWVGMYCENESILLVFALLTWLELIVELRSYNIIPLSSCKRIACKVGEGIWWVSGVRIYSLSLGPFNKLKCMQGYSSNLLIIKNVYKKNGY